MNRFVVKYFLFITFIIFMLFLSNDFGLIDIQKTAIVVSAGIDKSGDEFVLTTQIAVPQSSISGQSVEAIAVTGDGPTVADALKVINSKTSWLPNLVNCKVLILGEELARHNCFDGLDFFYRSEYFSDSCLVAVSEGKAQDLLNTTTPINDINSLAMQKILSKDAESEGNTISVTLKDFYASHFCARKSSFLPYIRQIIQEESTTENSGTQSTSSTGSSSGSNSKGTDILYTANDTMLFYDGYGLDILPPELSFAMSAVSNSLRLARYGVTMKGAPQNDENIDNLCLAIHQNDAKKKLKVENGMPSFNIELHARVAIADTNNPQSLLRLSTTNIIEDSILRQAEKQLKEEIIEAYAVAKKSNCDIFGIKKHLYQYHYKDYFALKDSIFDVCNFNVEVKMKDTR